MRYLPIAVLLVAAAAPHLLPAQPRAAWPDALGNFWAIEGSRVLKLNPHGQIVATHACTLLGEPRSIDPSDPFRVLVFYPGAQRLVFLNSDGAMIGQPVSLSAMVPGAIALACRAARGGAWLLHPQAAEVIHIDSRMAPSGLRLSLSPRALAGGVPTQMVESDGILYIGVGGQSIARVCTNGRTLDPLPLPFNPSIGFRIDPPYLWLAREGRTLRYPLNQAAPPVPFLCPCPGLPLMHRGEAHCLGAEGLTPCQPAP